MTNGIFAGPRAALAMLLGLEVLVFSATATNFLGAENFFEVLRLTVELGLLALALTAVIATGGIDLSVGSLLGLAAVTLGKLWRDAGWPIWAAAAAAVGVGALGGGANALLVTRLRMPPLIATLGTFWLFRGLAEGLAGSANVSGFPAGFQDFGQGYFAGVLPKQAPIFLFAAAGFWALLHRGVWGRAWQAIGFGAEGARHAAIPVERRIGAAYLLAGLAAGTAAVVYVARTGQAPPDAGRGYELAAIAAVALGGTSMFGGRASIPGTVLGLFAIAILKNGLRLADQSAELAGMLTGALLLAAVGTESLRARPAPAAAGKGEFIVRNGQVAALVAAMLGAAGLIAWSNWQLGGQLANAVREARPAASRGTAPEPFAPKKKLVLAVMPKSLGNGYFKACRKGAEEAAAELGATMLWDGPTEPDPSKQNEIVETWITRGVDAIAVAVENKEGISTALRKARQRGIPVVTWDSDAEPDARDFFVNQATPEGIGSALMDNAARVLGGQGEYAVITATTTAANMRAWIPEIEKRNLKYPGCKRVDLRPCDDKRDKAFAEATNLMAANKNLRLIMAICSPAVPGAADAVQQSGRKNVQVIGLGLPNENKQYVHAGTTECVVLWKTADLGYLAVQAAHATAAGALKQGAREVAAGRLLLLPIAGTEIVLGQPFVFNKGNIDQFDF